MSGPSRIRLLTAQVANKIAAGEVVDRPASVVKELVENALDAGGTQVDLEIVSGGRKLVAVTDNGMGMNRDDALMAIERHATSKILDVDDIEHIETMGFRGEALAAIASVSRFKLYTRATDDEVGTEVHLSAGKLVDVQEIGTPLGTRIEVRDLFFNVPARRKFLRTHQTELSHVRNIFIVLALANPAVGMSLTVDGRETYRLPGDAAMEDRIRDLFGPQYSRGLKPVSYAADGVKVEGYVSIPSATRSDRTEQYIFVNHRPSSAPVIAHAISEGYHALIERGRHPSVFLFLDMDPGLVDVNVHPTKKEVRFRRPSDVRDTLIAAIRAALDAERGAGASQMPEPLIDRPALVEQTLQIENLPPTRAFSYPRIPLARPGDVEPSSSVEGPLAPAPVDVEKPEGMPADAPWSWCRVLGQIGGLYVMMETDEGLVMMDPHAAHERVLFDKLMKQMRGGAVHSQGLLVPETVELRPADAERVRKNLQLFKGMGFGISEFGGDAFVIDALPLIFGEISARSVLTDAAQNLDTGGSRGARDAWHTESIAQASCKAAVKARDRLTLEEIERLVVDLATTEMPYTCPHGRPTVILMSYRELERKFGRA